MGFDDHYNVVEIKLKLEDSEGETSKFREVTYSIDPKSYLLTERLKSNCDGKRRVTFVEVSGDVTDVREG